MYLALPENIHTPTTEGIGNSRGVGGGGGGGGGQKPRKFQRGGGGGRVDGQIKFQMVQFDSLPTYSCNC